jgi:hypothetical protein
MMIIPFICITKVLILRLCAKWWCCHAYLNFEVMHILILRSDAQSGGAAMHIVILRKAGDAEANSTL